MDQPNFTTIAEIKDANARLGHFYFTKDTMSFFQSRVEAPVFGGRYFITSEARPANFAFGVSAGPRRFTIREARADGSIRTAGEFQAFGSAAEARAVARQLVAIREAGRLPICDAVDCPECGAPVDKQMICPKCGVDSFTPAPEPAQEATATA